MASEEKGEKHKGNWGKNLGDVGLDLYKFRGHYTCSNTNLFLFFQKKPEYYDQMKMVSNTNC